MAYVSVVPPVSQRVNRPLPPSPRVRRPLPGASRLSGPRLQPWEPMAYNLQGLGKKKGFFKKIGKVLKPITKILKPYLAPLVAMIPGVGIPAAAALKAVQTIRASVKAKAAQVAVVSDVQQAPSWGTMTAAQQQAVIAAIMAGQVPSVQVPPDVSAAYQQSIQRQAAALPPPPAAPGAPAPQPWETGSPAGAPVTEAGMGGMGAMLGIGAAAVVGMMMLGGGRR